MMSSLPPGPLPSEHKVFISLSLISCVACLSVLDGDDLIMTGIGITPQTDSRLLGLTLNMNMGRRALRSYAKILHALQQIRGARWGHMSVCSAIVVL
jgi:hypothetical protein